MSIHHASPQTECCPNRLQKTLQKVAHPPHNSANSWCWIKKLETCCTNSATLQPCPTSAKLWRYVNVPQCEFLNRGLAEAWVVYHHWSFASQGSLKCSEISNPIRPTMRNPQCYIHLRWRFLQSGILFCCRKSSLNWDRISYSAMAWLTQIPEEQSERLAVHQKLPSVSFIITCVPLSWKVVTSQTEAMT